MKKILATTVAFGMLAFAGSALATPVTWTDTIDFNPDVLVPPTLSYYHDITDGANGFESYFMNNADGNDQIFSFELSVEMYDDNQHTSWGGTATGDWSEVATILSAGGVATYEIDVASGSYAGATGFLGVIDLYDDGTLNVRISSLNGGDFYVASSTLIAYGDNGDCPAAPVPEPATMLLFGTGLAGLVGYNRKRSSKKS